MTAIQSITEITQVLKPFPIIADRVLKLVKEEDVNFQELTQLISTDPALSSLIISLANSPLYGTIRRPVDSVHRAILNLGRDHVIEAVMVHIMRSVRDTVRASWPRGDIYFWQHSVAVGIVTRILTTTLHLPFTQQALIAGILHDIGKLLLLNYNHAVYTTILDEAAQSVAPLHVLEMEYFGVTHMEIGHAACKKWNLPDEFARAINDHHDQPDIVADSLSNLVRNANLIVKIVGIGAGGNPFVSSKKLALLPHMRIRWSELENLIRELPHLVNELTSIIFGSGIAGHAQVLNLFSPNNTDTVFISVRNENEQLLLRYLLTAMGFRTQVDFKEKTSAGKHLGEIDYIVTDNPEQFPRGETVIINYLEWKKAQSNQRDDTINILALRNWLVKQFKMDAKIRIEAGLYS